MGRVYERANETGLVGTAPGVKLFTSPAKDGSGAFSKA